ncbi:MAG: thioesterase [Parvibaculum sp.]|nr:thioesterase [Parvibaculum sp.]
MTNSQKHTETDEDDFPWDPPVGFQESTPRGPYPSHNGPFFHKATDEGFWHGVRVQRRHCNSKGITHGGMLMAFADGLLGTAVYLETRTVALTARMNSDFLSSARPGEWLEGTARVTRATSSVAFCEAELYVGSRSVLRATGVFKLMQRHREKDAIPS